MDLTNPLILSIFSFIVMVPLSALLLRFATKISKLKDQSYKSAIIVVLIVFAINFALTFIKFQQMALNLIINWVLVLFLFAWWLIKTKYNLDWKKSFSVWLVWTLFNFALIAIVSTVIGAIMYSYLSGIKPGLIGMYNDSL